MSNRDQRTSIVLHPETADPADLIELLRVSGGAGAVYKLYGEHNKPTPADIGAAAESHTHAAGVVTGVYTGNGDISDYNEHSQFISLGFTPKAVLVFNSHGYTFEGSGTAWYYGGLAVTGNPVITSSENRKVIQIESGGFRVYTCYPPSNTGYHRAAANDSGATYHYIAIS